MENMASTQAQLKSMVTDGISVLKIDKAKLSHLYQSGGTLKNAIIIWAVPVVVNLIISALISPAGFGSFFASFLIWPVLIPPISMIVAIFAMGIIADKAFKAKGDLMKFFGVVSYAAIIFWLSIVPFLLGIAGIYPYSLLSIILLVGAIWIDVVAYNVLLGEYKLNSQNAIITVVLGIVAYYIVESILSSIFTSSVYSVFGVF